MHRSPSGLGFGRVLPVRFVSKVGSSFPERERRAKTERNRGAPKACLGPANYSEGKVPALGLSAPRARGGGGGGGAGGSGRAGAQGGEAGERLVEKPRALRGGERWSGRGAARCARAAPCGCGCGCGCGGAGIRGCEHLPAAPARSQALPCPPARTLRHTPRVSTAAAPLHALTCISLTSHLMAASGAGRARAGRGRAGAVAGRTRRGMFRAPAPEAAVVVRARELGREEGKLGSDPEPPRRGPG